MEPMGLRYCIGWSITAVANDGMPELCNMQADLMRPSGMRGCMNDTRPIIEALDDSECSPHVFDAIAIGQYVANGMAWVGAKPTTLAPPMPSITLIVIPTRLPMHVAEVVFLGEMIDKYLLERSIGVRVLRKQQYAGGVAVKPMGWMEWRMLV